jgi:hypothetical protein
MDLTNEISEKITITPICLTEESSDQENISVFPALENEDPKARAKRIISMMEKSNDRLSHYLGILERMS